jgi:hypothetical protein
LFFLVHLLLKYTDFFSDVAAATITEEIAEVASPSANVSR